MSQFILPRIGILAFMDDESREQLTACGAFLATTPGQVVIREAEPQTSLYVVISGVYHVHTQIKGREVHLDNVEPGDCFGEMAIFYPGLASATVSSAGEGQLWHLDVEALQQFMFDWHYAGCALVLGINTILSRRLKRANAAIKANEIVPGFLSVRSRKRVEGVKLE